MAEQNEKLEELEKNIEEQKAGLEKKEELISDDDAKKVFEADIMQIKEKYPFVKADDVRQLGNEFLTLMSAGASIGLCAADAYAATHTKEILENLEKSAEQQALAKLENKAHLKPLYGTGGSSSDVPQSVYEKYRRLMPGVSDSEIRRHYNAAKND